ncbi:MATE family efflux transporter [Cupriavidus sp. USMAA2-4]|uniref:MATE family efflux transporter n=1 Tax=Cupriavidus malaysiensis TaxID=367825 RepID=A0ABM6FFZ8_9BURK|nr:MULTISPECIES: MATE family efflux transporter [Cupriavidus]AOY97306.1 MATE family efflux transporter [Cupriavidus sp. USMAA2-4]AOZ04082.1 MATE family efflux transporter [Cupriavidus sp. USMAHM13]AOZ10845.1 MATE family efflux transporter [Cupriavidus malaysiensis]
MLEAPIAPTLARMSWPNMLMMLAQSSTGLIETWFLARLGTDVLAGVAVVVPVLMLMQNMSQGAMGGGISSAVARALGAGDSGLVAQLARHALAINLLIGVLFSLLLWLGARPLFALLGAHGAALDAASAYGRVLFAGLPLMWAMNALASVVRGTGNMTVPGLVICCGAALLIPLSPCLIFGLGPLPRLGVAGGAWALVAYYAAGTAVLGWYCLSGRCAARLAAGRLHWRPMRSILTIGALACLNPILTNALIAVTTAQVGRHGGTAALAGYATAARLEYLLIPIAFGLGAPMVALVGANIGAGQVARARRIAITGGAMAFVLAELVGLAASLWPQAWLRLFGADAQLLATGSTYLHIVGPFYGFFAMGFSLYFASQGAGRLEWPLAAGVLRFLLFAGAGSLALAWGAGLPVYFALGALAMTVYGSCILWSIAGGGWDRPRAPARATRRRALA